MQGWPYRTIEPRPASKKLSTKRMAGLVQSRRTTTGNKEGGLVSHNLLPAAWSCQSVGPWRNVTIEAAPLFGSCCCHAECSRQIRAGLGLSSERRAFQSLAQQRRRAGIRFMSAFACSTLGQASQRASSSASPCSFSLPWATSAGTASSGFCRLRDEVSWLCSPTHSLGSEVLQLCS